MTNGFESTDWTQNVTRLSGAAAAFSEDLLLNLRTERNGDIADLQILNIQHERKKNAIQALTEVLAQISGLRNYSTFIKTCLINCLRCLLRGCSRCQRMGNQT